jgi:hypothetical protein
MKEGEMKTEEEIRKYHDDLGQLMPEQGHPRYKIVTGMIYAFEWVLGALDPEDDVLAQNAASLAATIREGHKLQPVATSAPAIIPMKGTK